MKPAAPPATESPLLDTAELIADAKNPRRIEERARQGLASSLDRFGDLSGIVYNQRTKELVCGHQRMDRIRAKWGDKPIEAIDAANGLFGIRVDEKHYFTVRVVDWSRPMQRAANVAANSQAISGDFTESLSEYLTEIADDLRQEDASLLDDVLLVDLMAAPEVKGEKSTSTSYAMRFQVIIDCADEEQQGQLLERFTTEGLECRALIS